jgi:anti-anti-sigma factor
MVVAPKGRIGSVTAATFADAVALALRTGPRVIIDLTGVDYISGAGIRALQAATATNASQVVLCGLQEPVQIAMALAGGLEGAPVVKTRQEALESLIPNP